MFSLSNNNPVSEGLSSSDESYEKDKFNEAFLYSNINRCFEEGIQVHCGEFYAYYEKFVTKDFIVLENKLLKNEPLGKKEKGLKLHISIANISNNIRIAWEIVVKYIVKYNLLGAKVICNHLRDDLMQSKKQAGKEITIYAYMDKREILEWQQIIHEITLEFIDCNINPNRFPSLNNRIQGSKYFSYRNDSDLVSYRATPSDMEAEDQEDYVSENDEEHKIETPAKLLNFKNDLKISESSDDSSPDYSPLSTSDSSAEIDSDGNTPSDTSDDFSPFKNIKIDIPNQFERIKFNDVSKRNEYFQNLNPQTDLIQSASSHLTARLATNNYSFFSVSSDESSPLEDRQANDSLFSNCLKCCVIQ